MPRLPRALPAQARPGEGRVGGGQPAAGAITWALAMDHAELLSPGAAHSLLALAALLDGNGMPSTVFGTSAARDYLAYSTAGGLPGGPTVPDGLAALEYAGLLAADPATAPPMLQMSWLVQATVRAAMPARMLKGAAAAAADAVLEPGRRTTRRSGSPVACAPARRACGRQPETCCGREAATRCCCARAAASTRRG